MTGGNPGTVSQKITLSCPGYTDDVPDELSLNYEQEAYICKRQTANPGQKNTCYSVWLTKKGVAADFTQQSHVFRDI